MKTINLFSTLLAIYALFIFNACQSDACESSLCMNGGVCIDGTCDCPDRYTGRNCSELIPPDRIRIRSVQVTRFPATNGTMPWDEHDGPDLYYRLYEGDHPLSQPYADIQNADPDQDYYFDIEIMDMRNVLMEHTFELRDYDKDDEDEVLGSVKFIPFHTQNGFPDRMTLDSGGEVAFNIELMYFQDQPE